MKFVDFPKFNKTLYFVVSGILTASLLLFDLSLELGVAGGVTYIILVLFSLWGGKRNYIILAGITGTICVWLGYYYSPSGGENWKVLLNRFLSLFVIWVAVVICRAYQKSQDIIRLNAERLSNETRLRTLLNNTVDGIITIDDKGTIESFNPAAKRLFGYSELEAIGQNVKFLMPDPWKSEHDQYLQNYLQTGQAKIIGKGREVTGRRKNGTTFPLELSVSSMEIEGRLMFAGIVRDITERKTHEIQINRALKTAANSKEEAEQAKNLAESASKAKGEFLAHMSHEIRTPLNAILGYSQILNRSPSLEPDNRKAVQTIETSGNHLLELINEVLDYSKIEAGTKELIPKDFDLKELLEGLLALFENRCEDKNLMIRLEGTDQSPIYVNGDIVKLRQVLVNLLGNAIKFTTVGKIVLRLERKPDNHYKFEVIDTGLGIPKEDHARVLEPFKQSDSGQFKGGTGLGLSLSKELVNLMGGELSLESQVGKGSCFFFTMELPPAKAPVTKRSERSNKGDWCLLKTDSIKALVVDDIEVNRRLLSDILKSAGIEIEEAENGREAVDQTEKFKPDIIFMDIRMPVMDGKEAAIEINKQHASNPLKIVAITASVFDHERDEGFAEIFDDYITKPFRIERIYECMQSLLEVEFNRKEIRRDNNKQTSNETIPPPQDIDFSKITIPVQLFFKFKDIIEEGDVTQFEKELVDLHLLGEDGKLLNQSLTPLAEKYEWEKILTILEQVKIMGKGHD